MATVNTADAEITALIFHYLEDLTDNERLSLLRRLSLLVTRLEDEALRIKEEQE